MAVYFTSDTHFGHSNIIEIDAERRHIETIQEHDELIVERWNATVGPNDQVWHLGDVALSILAMEEWVPKLNGHKFVVAGNHDHCWTSSPDPKFARRAINRVTRYYEAGFERVYSTGRAVTQLADGRTVDLAHLPHSGDHTDEHRYVHQRPDAPSNSRPLLHGHVHGLWDQLGAQINVGVNVRDFRPISEEEIMYIIQRLR